VRSTQDLAIITHYRARAWYARLLLRIVDRIGVRYPAFAMDVYRRDIAWLPIGRVELLTGESTVLRMRHLDAKARERGL